MARRMIASGDRVYAFQGVANSALSTAWTIAALVRPDATSGDRAWVSSEDGNRWAVWHNNTDLYVYHSGGGSGRGFYDVITPGDWHLVFVSKAAGTATPRAHVYNYTEDTWTHVDGDGTLNNGTAGTGVRFLLGREPISGNILNGYLHAAAIFPSALTDGATEDLTDWNSWLAASPSIAWDLRKTPVEDYYGNSDELGAAGNLSTAKPVYVDLGFFASTEFVTSNRSFESSDLSNWAGTRLDADIDRPVITRIADETAPDGSYSLKVEKSDPNEIPHTGGLRSQNTAVLSDEDYYWRVMVNAPAATLLRIWVNERDGMDDGDNVVQVTGYVIAAAGGWEEFYLQFTTSPITESVRCFVTSDETDGYERTFYVDSYLLPEAEVSFHIKQSESFVAATPYTKVGGIFVPITNGAVIEPGGGP